MQSSHNPYEACKLCPRTCGAQRNVGKIGLCGATATLRVARSALHFWEEPPISGEMGSGAIFFSGCPLRCVFCQNQQISQGNFGHEITVQRLAAMMLELQQQGALNINLVTALHYAPQVHDALCMAKKAGLVLPIVCNTSGYELVSTIRAMGDVVDVWLPDFKYASSTLAYKLSGAKDYPEVTIAALEEMLAQVRTRGTRVVGDNGALTTGIIVRHLVLPGHIEDSCAVLDKLWELAGNDIDISIMNQYTPNAHCRAAGGNLARALIDEEYEVVLDYADDLGFEHMWWQQGGTVSESFVPEFDATGVEGPELSSFSRYLAQSSS
ncbi:radical SAM protein [Atopobium fossor]|uniref:radical SAM protein n=1 Tax=Atopobium fossor TaxID=39487 RepID=UPI000403DE5B|nr:radical SAM protein [Atopobium fossor]